MGPGGTHLIDKSRSAQSSDSRRGKPRKLLGDGRLAVVKFSTL